MNKIYSSKISTLNEFGYKRIDQEGIFTSFENAFEFIESSFFENPSTKELKLYRYDITEIELNSDRIVTIWEYDCKGELLNRIKQIEVEEKREILKFQKGEIVQLRANEYCESSNFDNPVLAVISEVPNLEKEFVVDYISNLGYLDHLHIELNQIEKFEDEIPHELEFLKTLSDFHKNKIQIKEKDLNEIRNCNVYLRNIKSYKELKINEDNKS